MPTRNPHARSGQCGALAAEDPGGGAVRDHAAARLDHHRAGGQADDLLDAVLDDHGGGAGGGQHRGEHLPDQRHPGRVEVGGDLVEQQQPGAQRDDAGQRQPLLLAAGQGAGGGVASVGEADGRQRLVDPPPDLAGRDAAVLQSERDVVAGPAHHQRRLGVLQDQPSARPGLAGRQAVEEHRALLRTRVGGVEQAGQRCQQGALAGAGRPEEQHPLAGLDPQVDPAQRPGLAAAVPPAPAADVDGDGRDGSAGRLKIEWTRAHRTRRASGASASIRGVRSVRVRSVRPGPGRRRTGTAREPRCGPGRAPAATTRGRR
jgi:hypothetical protein